MLKEFALFLLPLLFYFINFNVAEAEGNIYSFYDEIAEQHRANEALRQQRQEALNQAYLHQVQSNPNMPLSNEQDYSDIVKQKLNDYASAGIRRIPEETNIFIQSDDLLRAYFSTKQEQKDAYIRDIVARSNQIADGNIPSYNPYLGDIDPTTQVQPYNTIGGENSFVRTIKDIGVGLDYVLYKTTGLAFSDDTKRAVKENELKNARSNLGIATHTGMTKLAKIQQLQEQAEQLSHIADPYTEEGRRAQTQLNNVTALINSISSSLSDAEKFAIRQNGKQYTDITNELGSLQAIDNLSPRYAEDYYSELDDAEFERKMLHKYTNPRILNPR